MNNDCINVTSQYEIHAATAAKLGVSQKAAAVAVSLAVAVRVVVIALVVMVVSLAEVVATAVVLGVLMVVVVHGSGTVSQWRIQGEGPGGLDLTLANRISE